MFRFSRFGRAALAVLGAAALTLLPAGCSKKKLNTIDATYVPEGTPSPKAVLLVYPDAPIKADKWVDNGPQGTSPDDVFLEEFTLPPLHPGAVLGTLLDSTNASSYELFRRESNGGFHRFQDYVTRPAAKWLDTQWEAYNFVDPSPSGYQPPSYLGRGVVGGAVTAQSPLTNEAALGARQVANIAFDFDGAKSMEGPPWPPFTTASDWGLSACDSAYHPPDTLFTMAWQPVAGASGYWIQIYQFAGDAIQKMESGYPQPLSLVQTRDFFVAYVPATTTHYRIGDPGAIVLTRKTMLSAQEYDIRISAVDATGTLLAFTYGNGQKSSNGDKMLDTTTVKRISGSYLYQPPDPDTCLCQPPNPPGHNCPCNPAPKLTYVRYWLGAVRVFPKAKLAPCGQ